MDWGEHCDYGLALTPGFVNLLFCSELRSLQRRKPIPCFVLRCCSSSKITFWLTIYFPNLFVMWCRWWLGGGRWGGWGLLLFSSPPSCTWMCKGSATFQGFPFGLISLNLNATKRMLVGVPFIWVHTPLKPICVGFPVALSQGKYHFWVTVGLPFHVSRVRSEPSPAPQWGAGQAGAWRPWRAELRRSSRCSVVVSIYYSG